MRRIEMEKAKEILRLSYEAGLSRREAAQGTGCSPGTVSAILARVKEAGIANPPALPSKKLGAILHPPVKRRDAAKNEPDAAHIDRETKRKGVALFLLWEECKIEHPDGFMRTRFCKRCRECRKRNDVCLRKACKAGERILADWAGLAMRYADDKGKEYPAYVFVATLPASGYLYVEPFRDMKLESWIDAHIHAFEHFGGTPHIIVPDNAKTAVKKVDCYEPELNRTCREMAGHCGAVIVPARPYRPTDKAPVETGAQIVERRIVAKLRRRQFLSFEEVREAVQEELEAPNTRAFQKLPGSRLSSFLETEKHELTRLPASRYECAQWKEARVAFDCHVALDRSRFYSVSYRYVGKQVKIRSASHTVEVFYEGERIACHIRSYDPHRRYVTESQHMPERHRAAADRTPERFTVWAAKTGEQTKAHIASLLGHWEHPEQAFKTCAGILRMAQTVPPEQMEQACARAMECQVHSHTPFARLLKKGEAQPDLPIQHENARGSGYCEDDAVQGGGHVE